MASFAPTTRSPEQARAAPRRVDRAAPGAAPGPMARARVAGLGGHALARRRRAGAGVMRQLLDHDLDLLQAAIQAIPGDDRAEELELRNALFIRLGGIESPFNSFAQIPAGRVRHEYDRLMLEEGRYATAPAALGKRVAYAGQGYDAVKDWVERIAFNDPKSGEAYKNAAAAVVPTTVIATPTLKMRAFVKPLETLTTAQIGQHPEIRDRVHNLVRWYLPLHTEAIKGIVNQNIVLAPMKDALAADAERLRNAISGTPLQPAVALIGMGPLNAQGFATWSSVVTGARGAVLSGEKATPRQAETDLTAAFGVPVVAGHLVADTLGGKDAAANLTPMTSAFNTNAWGMQAPEATARARLALGQVIRYVTSVTYSAVHGRTLATQVHVTLETLALRDGGTATEIADYTKAGDALTWSQPLVWPAPK
jgi:DNA/RNA non-specific endonuclease